MIYKIFSYVVFVIFASLAVLFSVSNSQIIELTLTPLPLAISMPVYLAIQITAFVSFIIGAFTAYIFSLKNKQLLRYKDTYIAELERQIAEKK